MANNLIQIKRTSVSGRAANTTTLPNPGELALNMTDGILYSTNGSSVFEIGANNTNVNVSGNLTVKSIVANGSIGTSGQVLKSNGSATYWGTDNADVGANNQILYRNSSNVLTTSSGLVYDGVSIKVNGNLESLYQNGDEGGEIFLAKPVNTSISGTGITLDIYQNKLRIFENGGNNRGAYIDITAAANGVGTNLLTGGTGGTGTVTSVGSGNGLTGGPITNSGTLSVLANNGITANSTGLFVNQGYNYSWTATQTFQANIAFTGDNISVVSNTGSVMFAGSGDTNWRIGRSTNSFTKFYYTNNSLDFIAANSNLEGIAFGFTGDSVYLETGYAGTFTKNPIYVGNSTVNVSINSTSFTGTANNATNLGGVAAASYVQNTDSRTLSGNLYFTGANNLFDTAVYVGNSTTTTFTANTSGLYPTSNTVGQALGNTTARWSVSASSLAATGTTTLSSTVTLSGTTTNINATSLTTGTINLGGATQTGAINIGRSTANQTLSLANGATTSGDVKTISIGEAGAAGSQTNITIGSSLSNTLLTVNANNSLFSGLINATSYYVGTTLIANSTGPYGKTEDSLNVNNAVTVGGNTANTLRAYSDTQAATAYSNAVATAASDASTKAGTAYSNATSYADTKAGTAYSNATVFASNASNINTGTLAEARLPYRMNQNVRTSDTVEFAGMTLTGNLVVSGNVNVIGANNLSVSDNMIYLNANNDITNPDIGITGNYNDGTYQHTGFFRDATDGVWKVFDSYLPEPDANVYIDTSNASFKFANFQANIVYAGNSTVYSVVNSTAFNTSTNTVIIGNNNSYFVANGNVGIGNSAPANKLSVNGTGYFSANLTTAQTASANIFLISGSNDYITPTTGVDGWYYANTFSVSAQDGEPRDLSFSSNGSLMYILGNGGDDVNMYTLSTPWDITSATYSNNFSIASQDLAATGLTFKPDGTAMYITGDTNNSVFQYTLGTAWDIGTASYASKSFSTATQDTNPQAVEFSSDGTEMFIVGDLNNSVFQYTLGTAWDVTTASYTSTLSVATYETVPQGIAFNSTGTKMYIVGTGFARLIEYDLGTAWTLSTATFSQFSVISNLGTYLVLGASGIYYSEAQGKAYISDYQNDAVFQLTANDSSTKLIGTKFVFQPDVLIQSDLIVDKNSRFNGEIRAAGAITTGSTLSVSSTTALGGAVGLTATTQNINAVSQTTGTINLGGASQTGAINIGRSTANQTLALANGITASGSIKTLNIATLGAAGSQTNITVGATLSNTLVTVNANNVVFNNDTDVTISVGNSTVNSSINSTAFSGSANNANNLGGVAAASYVQNTDSRTLSGNLIFSGANVYFNTDVQVTNTVTINTNIVQVGISSAINTTLQTVVDSFSATAYRSAKYLVQITNAANTAYQSQEILVLHDGVTAYVAEYAAIYSSGTSLGTFAADVTAGNVRLLVTLTANSVVTAYKTMIKI